MPTDKKTTKKKATKKESGKKEVEKFFEKNYKKDLTREAAIKLAIDALKQVSSAKFNPKNVNIAIIEEKDKKFEQLDSDKIEATLKAKS